MTTKKMDALQVSSACSAAEEFIKHHYDMVDKVRHKLSKLYHTEATLIWNGNIVRGNQQIQTFYEELPLSQHTVMGLDSQPVNAATLNGQAATLITANGTAKFEDRRRSFHQSFLIAAQDDKWKVVSDTYRFQELPPE